MYGGAPASVGPPYAAQLDGGRGVGRLPCGLPVLLVLLVLAVLAVLPLAPSEPRGVPPLAAVLLVAPTLRIMVGRRP
ncbi:hypothetical protein OG594_07570 [Streptomyces sp. NBC_01214]|uniref:hypothetical protein n=1 Tax=Streptomyces sp. NBC_01214 TaxID=2903777 RepID=UPI0022597BE1|nr:hypothetical protein [Streptomyces sp. NBC_01214]MCX4801513.1 hypothetical protein [Streptomyces sp. NBC_01214]